MTKNEILLLESWKNDNINEQLAPTTKQRSQALFELRKKSMVTDSTLHKVVGLETLKVQVQHYEEVVHKKQKTEFDEETFATNMNLSTVTSLLASVIEVTKGTI